MSLEECFRSFEESSVRLESGARFAYLPGDSESISAGGMEILRGLCTINKTSLIGAIKQTVEAASLGNPFPQALFESKIQDALLPLYDLFSNLSRHFNYNPSDLSVRLIPPSLGEIDALSLRTFHTDRVEDFFFLHTLSAEGDQEAGTEVAGVEATLYEQLLELDREFRVKREQSRAGKADRAELVQIREQMNNLVPEEAILRTRVGDTLILRGDDLPTFHRGPNHRMKRVLLGMPNLTIKG